MVQDTISARKIYLDGRPMWRYSDGTVLPWVGGGSDTLDPPGVPAPTGISTAPPKGPAGRPPLTPAPNVFVDAQGNLVDEQGRRLFPEDSLGRVRQEEKDKLYPTIEGLKAELSELKRLEKERAEAEQARLAALEAERKAKAEAELDAKALLEQRSQEWAMQAAQLQQQLDEQRAIAEKERQLAELTTYRSQRIAELGSTIHPIIARQIRGNTREEIDASIAQAQQDTAALFEEMQRDMAQPPPRPTGPYGVTGATPVGPNETSQPTNRTYTPEELRDMSLEEYAQVRSSLQRAVYDRVRSGGYSSV